MPYPRQQGREHPRFKDLDGQTFGTLTVLNSYVPDSKHKALVRCGCGKTFEVRKSSIQRGHTSSCGKSPCRRTTVDLVGRRFTYLTVVKFLKGKTEHYNTLWLCRCDCGKELEVVGHSLTVGYTQSCGCQTALLTSVQNTLTLGRAKLNEVWNQYRGHAKKLDLPFGLSFEQFQALIFEACHYCGADSSNYRKGKGLTAQSIKYNGIDRKDSALGYTPDNCVTACRNCNYAKRRLSYADFIALAQRIAARF